MNSTAISFANIHNHGELFANVLRVRRESVTQENRWEIPETVGIQYDQYDTPQSRWLAVHDDAGDVLASVRLTPTTAQCGIYSYMIRDAQNGLLDSIPTDLLHAPAPISESIWEVTRGFVASNICSDMRQQVRKKMVMEILRTSREEGISSMLALLPSHWSRWANHCLLDMQAAGRHMKMGGKDYQAVRINVSAQLN